MRLTAIALVAGALIGAPAAAQQAASAPEIEETPEVLPAGDGRDEVFYGCTACHSTRLVRNQGMSRARWAETLVWMTEKHGMPEFEPAERELVLDYLATHFGEKAETGRTPFLTQPARPNPFLKQD